MKRILVVEDNEELAFGLRNNLEIEGYRVELAADGAAGLAAARREGFDLVILDLMLPELDGFRVLRGMREARLSMPVLILTARGDESNKVRGLKMGADDYVTKPFGLLELLARVEALLRRGPAVPEQQAESFGKVLIDRGSRSVYRDGKSIDLAPKEYELLLALMARPNAVVSRFELMRDVWGYADSVVTRTIDTHIAELRRKLEENPGEPQHILTVRKVGYRLKP